MFKQLDSKKFYEQKILNVKVCISTLPDFTVNLVKDVSVTNFRGIWRQGFLIFKQCFTFPTTFTLFIKLG